MRICREKGADLVKVSSAEENNFLRRSGKKWWLALRRDAIHKNMFKWNDGSMPNFTDWSLGEPNNANGNEECANYHYNGKWNDMGCSATVDVACEKGMNNLTIVSLRLLKIRIYNTKDEAKSCRITFDLLSYNRSG